MILFVLAFLGGVLTIASPCILPVLPFVFARADKPFLRNGLPMLAGMSVTFAAVATLAAVGGGWAAQANQYGRLAALALLALFGLALLFPALADRAAQPLVGLGSRLSNIAGKDENESGVAGALLLGVATGLLWAPCAGPILGLILTGAALNGANAQTTLLLAAYALGAATSLALALLAGGRVFAAMKRSLGLSEWVRRGFGLAVLAGVVAIASGLDTGVLTRASLANTSAVEQALLDKFHAAQSVPAELTPAQPVPSNVMSGGDAMMTASPAMMMQAKPVKEKALPVLGDAPELSGAVEWLNSPPLTLQALRGRVVLVDFWTYSCINCLRTLPYIKAWAEKYRDRGLVVIGVHAPEFAFEKDIGNVRRAVADLGVAYPVAIDNDYAIWRAFKNQYWPAHYFIDAQGKVRRQHFGEGEYDESERVIQQLLVEAGQKADAAPLSQVPLAPVKASGVEAPPLMSEVRSPETYIGFARAENFISPGGAVEKQPHVYEAPQPRLNEWGLAGDWTIGEEQAALNAAGGAISYRFHARDLNLVLGPGAGKPIRFRVTIDGARPGDNHGVDASADGEGQIAQQRLYQLIRQGGAIGDHTFEIQFLDPDVTAYAFTFG
jgi:cytochrome c biogenesis protein CcdA/thiol-disulfide isomerase/thioredoxin